MKFDALSRVDMELIRQWRNEDISGARTPFLLTKEMQEDFYDKEICSRDSKHRYWAITGIGDVDNVHCAASDSWPRLLLGIAGLTNIEWVNARAEIALMIRSDDKFRGQGFGREALRMLFDKAFDELRLNICYGVVNGCNPYYQWWLNRVEQYKMFSFEIPLYKWWDGRYYKGLYFQKVRE